MLAMLQTQGERLRALEGLVQEHATTIENIRDAYNSLREVVLWMPVGWGLGAIVGCLIAYLTLSRRMERLERQLDQKSARATEATARA